MHFDSEALFRQLSALQAEMPNFRVYSPRHGIPHETQRWTGRLHALLQAAGLGSEAMTLRVQMGLLQKTSGQLGGDEIVGILHRALAHAELRAPATAQGSFIAAGSEFQAFATLAKILEEVAHDVLIVDPYMDEVALMDFAVLTREGVTVRLLAADGRAKPTLRPAAERWLSEYGPKRPLEVRLAPASMMHDRLILIDSSRAWLVTQSLKDFAKRAHGSIELADSEAAAMKIEAYAEIWKVAKPLL